MNKKSITAGLLTFVIALAVTSSVAVFYLITTSNSRREKAQFIADSFAGNIQSEIQRREYITRMMEIQVQSSKGSITGESFRVIAEEVFNDYLDIIDITLAPDGIVRYKYPLDNGIAERENLFEDSARGVYADYSKMSGTSVIIVPTILADDSYGIIITRPIYTSEEVSDANFWGFASVTLSLSRFLSAVDLKGLAESNYEYKIVGNNAITGEDRIIIEYSEKELQTPVESMVSTVGGGYWILAIAPMDHWMNLTEILSALLIAVVMSALAAAFVAAYISMKEAAKELEILSYRDALTNLNNPRSYHEHMDELSKKKLPYGLIFMDLNDFKMVNDTYGHDAGDELLNIVAKRLQNSIREKDKAFRIGGDEFVVVIHGTHDKSFYESVITRMRENVARDVVLSDVTLKVSISAGYARCPEDGTKFEDVVKKADELMYENKRRMKAKRAAVRGAGAPQTGR